ncbi:complement factor B [Ixodes scapularis]
MGRFYFDKPRSVEESLRNQLTRLAEEPAKLNKNDEQLERSINVNERGVRHIVYFAFDASASIGLNNLKTGIGLAKAITRKINVTDDGHRVGAVRFNNTAKLMLSPMNVKSTDAALLALDAVATEKTAGGTAIREAVRAITTSLEIVDRHLKKDGFKLKFSIFFITDGKANLGGSPAKDVENLRKRHYADIYCIGLTGSPDHSALKQLATDTDHVFILRNYAVMQWLADHLTNGTTVTVSSTMSSGRRLRRIFRSLDSSEAGRTKRRKEQGGTAAVIRRLRTHSAMIPVRRHYMRWDADPDCQACCE